MCLLWMLAAYLVTGIFFANWMLLQSLASFFAAGWAWKRMVRYYAAWTLTWPALPCLYLMGWITGEE